MYGLCRKVKHDRKMKTTDNADQSNSIAPQSNFIMTPLVGERIFMTKE